MRLQSIALILLFLLLAESSFATPWFKKIFRFGSTSNLAKPSTGSETEDSDDEDDDDDGEPERSKPLNFALSQFNELGNFNVRKGSEIFEKVLRDVAVVRIATHAFHLHTNALSEFIKRVREHEMKPTALAQGFDLVMDFNKIVEKCDTSLIERPTPEDLLFELEIKKNGLEELESEYSKRFLAFSDEFAKVIDDYFGTLSRSEKKKEKKLVEWYKRFKAETDTQKKIDIFAKFFEFYV